MSGNNKDNRSPAIAAAIIMVGAGIVFFLMPKMMLWLGSYSPWLAAVFAALAVLAFFVVFWLRARYQRGR